MSISVDDLVSSLSSSHIGQEAIDLATLQAQLSQTMFGQPFPAQSSASSIPRGEKYAQPCNTPTARTPSSSFASWGQMASSSSSGPPWVTPEEPARADYDMEEDERMVEELLMPSSPVQPSLAYADDSQQQEQLRLHLIQQQQHKTLSLVSPLGYTTSPSAHSPSASLYSPHALCSPSHDLTLSSPQSTFTTTDPFYIAQLQPQAHHNTSLFAQSGRPGQASPFLRTAAQQQLWERELHLQQQQQAQQQAYHHREHHGYNPTPALFVQTSAAF